MHVEANVMAHAMDEVPAQRIAMQIFTVRVYVLARNAIERIRIVTSRQPRLSRLEHLTRSLLRSQHNVIEFALPRDEFAIYRPRDRALARTHPQFTPHA